MPTGREALEVFKDTAINSSTVADLARLFPVGLRIAYSIGEL
jgi:hypothetical protein